MTLKPNEICLMTSSSVTPFKVYIVNSYEDIYGAFSSLKKAKKYALALIDKYGDYTAPYFSIYSIELDKELLD